MEQRLTIVGLGVSDLKTSTEFYEEKLGWKKTDSSNESISFFELNGILLSLYPTEKLAEDAGVDHRGEGFKGFSLAHNTRTKEEVDSLIASLESKGVKIVKRPEEVFWGGYSSYIADPDGHLWEIAFNPYLPLDAQGNVK
ncbi:VOC family protein [Leptobacterium flavescens]|uniref:VOC family protein n=1 Tax=Leptobacterium flavescens TaxID=472055 RepID=A0A6P0UNX1_9FLAO|nr:VOC family protein [Leptobacterium flavescens]NER15014.1 VOC family protein [Leptobacterium flavescens]